MNRKFDFGNKEFESELFLAQINEISKALVMEEVLEETVPNAKELGNVVTKIIQANELFFGLTAKDEKIKSQMTKLDHQWFRNFEVNGTLYTILKIFLIYKQETMIKDFDFTNIDRVMPLLQKIKEELSKKNLLNVKTFHFSPKVSLEEVSKYKKIISKFGGKIDEKNFSHYIEVGELKPQPEYKAIDNFKTSKTLIHWTNYPNSYDQWINKPVDEIFQKPTKKTWKLTGKYLTDSEKFNEWMEEMDYDLEATSAQKRKIQHEEPDSKKSKEDLKAEDYKISVVIPSHATWFSMEDIHSIEKRSLPEFFDSKSTTKTPEIYKQYRNFMVETFRKDSDKYLSATECRKYLAGDISAIIKVFSFLEHWGLINYGVSPERIPSSGNEPTTLVHEYSPSEKLVSLELPSFGVQPTYTVPIKSYLEKGEWSPEEVLQLLKAIELHKDDWNKISTMVGSRTREECLSYFLKMPIEDEFLNGETKLKTDDPLPFGDSHNPIMQTVAFLASMVHPSVAASAAQAALQSFSNLETNNVVDLQKMDVKTISTAALASAAAKSKILASKEEREIQRLVASILEKQMKKVEFKLKQLDHLEKLMGKERQQMEENKKKLENEKLQFMAEKMNKKK